MGFYEVLWHGDGISDGGDLEEALQGYALVRPDDGDWQAACATAGADPCIRRYASFEAFLDNADELETIPVTAAMIEAALADLPPRPHLRVMAEPNLGPRLDLARFTPVNHLWPELVERLGLERSSRAVQQALDLQAMHGTAATLPLLLVETCGLALVPLEQLRLQTGLVGAGERLVLLLSQRSGCLQLLSSG